MMQRSQGTVAIRNGLRAIKATVRDLADGLGPPSAPLATHAALELSPAERAAYAHMQIDRWLRPCLLGPLAIADRATDPETARQVFSMLRTLEPDELMPLTLKFYEAGLERFGTSWRYADLLTTLLATVQLTRPRRYLEIGVRRGRSMALLASAAPECDIVGFDLWIEGYGDVANPGPEFVRDQLRTIGHTGRLDLISGNTQQTVPAYLRQHPDSYFDLITVDGDHGRRGATIDLRNTLPRLAVGGVLLFDDVALPGHDHLLGVWRRTAVRDRRYATWTFDQLGFGVGVAVRKY